MSGTIYTDFLQVSKELNELVASGKATEALVRWKDLDVLIASALATLNNAEGDNCAMVGMQEELEKTREQLERALSARCFLCRFLGK